MISHIRQSYNANFSDKRYQSFLQEIERQVNYKATFKIAETPVFIPDTLKTQLLAACEELVDTLCRSDFMERSQATLFPGEIVPNETAHTHFLSIDFGICSDGRGGVIPQLIEIQGFPSLFFYQHLCATAYQRHFNLPTSYNHLLNNHTSESYLQYLKEVIVGDSKPASVALVDIEPEKQNTRIDFLAAEKLLGIKTLCLSQLETSGRSVYYTNEEGKKVEVERIYNRVIFDELNKRPDLKRSFHFDQPYDVKWIGHPHWFARISKHTLPLFDSVYVPATYYLDNEQLPTDLENYVLKPLYSFSGQGVIIHPKPSDIEAIDAKDRPYYILQKKVAYAPIVETLDEPAKMEVRIMMAWKDGAARPEALTNLVRLSKGEMIGVKYNKGKTWVGGSVGFFEGG